MNKHIAKLIGLLTSGFFLTACSSAYTGISEKEIYIPEEFKGQDWNTDEHTYSFKRMSCTDNMAILWEKGFGENLSVSPMLENQPMEINLANLEAKLEAFYQYFKDTLQFVKPGSLSEKYRMMVMVKYSLEGTAYGGTYDDTIGALWVTPNRLQDHKLNTVAHELGHSFQAQISADKMGECWNGNPIFEMCSQWMLWQVNPEWVADENYHWQAFKENTHKAFLHLENMYRSPYVLEYWGQKYGKPYIAELFRQGKGGEDPVITHQRIQKMNQESFNDEIFDAYRQMVNFDYIRVYPVMRKWANSFQSMAPYFAPVDNGWQQIKAERCPENYGINIIPLSIPEAGQTVKIDFKGIKNGQGYNTDPSKSGWCYGFIAVDDDEKTIYGKTENKSEGVISFTVPTENSLKYLWLLVMGAPEEHTMNSHESADLQWPYKINVTGASIL